MAASAQRYSEPLVLAQAIDVFARVLGETWSARVRGDFLVEQDYSGLGFNRLHYHPTSD